MIIWVNVGEVMLICYDFIINEIVDIVVVEMEIMFVGDVSGSGVWLCIG